MPKVQTQREIETPCKACQPGQQCGACAEGRVRILQACKPCGAKKMKCDGNQPCRGCRKNPSECVFPPVAKKRGPPKGYRQQHEALVEKVSQLESLLEQYQRSQAGSPINKKSQIHSELPLHGTDLTTQPATATPRVYFQDTSVPQMPRMPSPPQTSNSTSHASPPSSHSAVQENVGGTKYWGASSGFHMLPSTREAMSLSRVISSETGEDNTSNLVTTPPHIPVEVADYLIRIYFTYTHRHFPLVFTRSTEDVRRTFPPFLLYAIYAIASRVSEHPSFSQPGFGDRSFSYCCYLLVRDCFTPSLSTCQGLVLMSLRELACGKGAQGWIFGGIAMRMATDLGLHRNVELVRGQKMNQIELESRRRTFWNCYIVDQIASAFLGRPVSLKDGDFDTPYPDSSVADEFEVWVDETEAFPRYKGNYAKRTFTISNFTQLAKLMRIVNHILAEVYTLSQRREGQPYAERVRCLDEELEKWKSEIPPELQIDNDPAPLPHIMVVPMYYHLAKILLHRSNIALDKRSVDICRQSSASISDWILRYSELYGLRKITSGCMHALFAAALIQIYDLRNPDDDIQHRAKQRFEMCCSLLLSVAESWPLARHLHNLLQDARQDRTRPPSRQMSPPPTQAHALDLDSEAITIPFMVPDAGMQSSQPGQAGDPFALPDLDDVFSWEQLQALAPLGIPTDFMNMS